MMTTFSVIPLRAVSPDLHMADPHANMTHIRNHCETAYNDGISLIVFPELSVTGYTCQDLFMQKTLLDHTEQAVQSLAKASKNWPGLLIFIGLPIVYYNALYNCAAAISDGTIHALIPKTHLPNTHEFYEKRWFSSGAWSLNQSPQPIQYAGQQTHLGQVILEHVYQMEHYKIGCEICEDLWAPSPVSTTLTLNGAELIVNLSASNELVGKTDYRKQLVLQQSARLNCAYLYCGAGQCESTTDLVFGGHCLIAENGQLLGERPPFDSTTQTLTGAIDLDLIRHERIHNQGFQTFTCQLATHPSTLTTCFTHARPLDTAKEGQTWLSIRPLSAHPFIPTNPDTRHQHCLDVLNLQAHALIKRLQHIHSKTCIIGISGGLDSTLALMATCHAYDLMGWSHKDIIGITMPGFGTTDHTHGNAVDLMNELGITLREISIHEVVLQHFKDIDHDPTVHDITYENAQARARTQILMDVANQTGGIVIGTGDLSELALGWCTYNGDQMSMYGLNAGIPKTLLRHILTVISNIKRAQGETQIADRLMSIIHTPISPELLPPDENGQIAQHTEVSTGPYELHDYFLYYTLKYGYTKTKMLAIAHLLFTEDGRNTVLTNRQTLFSHLSSDGSNHNLFDQDAQQKRRVNLQDAFKQANEKTSFVTQASTDLNIGTYEDETILHWYDVFIKRFFAQQFKRSPMPDGPKVGSIGLSPRGDWRMPSDAKANIWLDDIL